MEQLSILESKQESTVLGSLAASVTCERVGGLLHLNLVLLEGAAGAGVGIHSGAGNKSCLQEKTNTRPLPNVAPTLQGSWGWEEEVGSTGTQWRRGRH